MNNSNEPLYLSAGEAAAELSISPATLYAYVSRGLVRSEPTGQGTRGRRYRAEDVRSLKNRRAPLVEGVLAARERIFLPAPARFQLFEM